MRFLAFLLIVIPLAAVAVSFSISNRELATFVLWPLPQELVVPRFLAVLVPLVVGVIVGGLIAWLSAGRHRTLASRRGARLEQLNAEVRRLRERQAEFEAASRRAAEAERLTHANATAGAVTRLDKPLEPATIEGR